MPKKRVRTDESEEKAPKKARKRIQKRKKETELTQNLGNDQGTELVPKLEESMMVQDGPRKSGASGEKQGGRNSQLSAENLSSHSKSSSILEQQALIKRSLHTYYDLITAEIEDHQIYSLSGVSMNFLFLFRLILIELIMISQQNLQLIQVLMINFINITYYVWLMRGIFRDKIYQSGCEVAHKIVMESAIQIFLLMTVFFYLDRNNTFLSSMGSIIVQMICIFSIAIALIYELFIVFYHIIRSVREAYKKRKMMREQFSGVVGELFGKVNPTSKQIDKLNERGIKMMNNRTRNML